MTAKLISIIVPVYNSRHFLSNLLCAIDEVKVRENWDLELILIDDGSTDNSFEEIRRIAGDFPYVTGIKLSRNFGHQAAVSTGLSLCNGEYVAIIDDDLQDPPKLLPSFFDYLDNGYDVAYGVRKQRKESFLKIIAYKSFYRLLQMLSEIYIPMDTGDFCVMKRRVVDAMLFLHEKNPFLRGIRSWVGFKQIGVEYERHGREYGKSGYTLRKLLKIAADGIFSFSNLPLRLTTFLGIVALSVAIVYALYILGKFCLLGIEAPGFVTLVLMILFFGSVNLISIGIVGEYIARIYAEGKNRPHAIISESTTGEI